jgi:para-nitrobenzyl esterase
MIIMRTFTLAIAGLLVAGSSYGQCDGNRYRHFVFAGFETTSNIQYGSNVNYAGQNTNLMLDIYQPAEDLAENRPLIVMAHGGSFVAGSKTGTDVVPLCTDLAKMGYVVASISYRLGMQGMPILPNEITGTEAVIRGYHDMKAAIRWFRKSVAEDGNPYRIDPELIFSAGVSAGGFIALHVGYLDQESEMPNYNPNHQGVGGGLEGLSGNPGYPSHVAGVVNIAGALKDTSWIQPGDAPVLLFHGTNDGTVPFDVDVISFLGLVNITEVCGSNAVAIKAEQVGLNYCFRKHLGMGHVPHTTNAAVYDTTRSMASSFLSHLICPDVALECDYRTIEVMVGVDNAPEIPLTELFPNPARERFTLRTNRNTAAGTLRMYDSSGKLVKQLRTPAGIVQTEVSIREIHSGLYHVVWQIDGETNPIAFRLVVE